MFIALASGMELTDDLPALFTQDGSDELDRDPKVSGQIIVKGNATDENRIGSFTVTFENVSATAEFTASTKTWNVTDASNNKSGTDDQNTTASHKASYYKVDVGARENF